MTDIEEMRREIWRKVETLYDVTKSINDLRYALNHVYKKKTESVEWLLDLYRDQINVRTIELDKDDAFLDFLSYLIVSFEESKEEDLKYLVLIERILNDFRTILFDEGIEDIFTREVLQNEIY